MAREILPLPLGYVGFPDNHGREVDLELDLICA